MMNMNPYQLAAPESNNNNDQAFLSLLSSQRELLQQLNRENSEGKPTHQTVNFLDHGYNHGGAINQTGAFAMNGGSFQQQQQNAACVSPNRSIAGGISTSVHDQVVTSKRFSFGFGGGSLNGSNDMMMMTSPVFVSPMGADDFANTKLGSTLGLMAEVDLGFPTATNVNDLKRDKDELLGLDDIISFKKRRLSGAGIFSRNVFTVDDSQPQRRFSLSPLVEIENGLELPVFSEEDDDADDDDQEEILVANAMMFGAAFEPRPIMTPPATRPKQRQPAKKPKAQRPKPFLIMKGGDPKETRKALMSLSSAMEKTQKSQQDIHDWDRKMGLKRSHSKTMRLTTRSRKKLRAMLKKQITALNSKKR